jgi:hypothetical protein
LQAALPKRFELIRCLGEGGMGIVYEAHDREKDARIAIKTLRSFSADALARFKHEFRALSDIQHPNLVGLGELISENDQWFFTMDLVDGTDFLSYVRPPAAAPSSSGLRPTERRHGEDEPTQVLGNEPPRAYDEDRLRRALAQLAEGLSALHAAQKVHRDIKPSNIRVTSDERVVLLDFGLVTDLSSEQMSTEMHVVGTPSYMAPEQAASKHVTPAADWYAVGVLLYQALTGALPFTGTAIEILLQKQQTTPPPPGSRASGTPADLEELCMALMRFEPSARPIAKDVLRALRVKSPEPRVAFPSASSLTIGATFVGRDSELELLAQTYRATRGGKAAAAFLYGESGVGKSCLVKQFTDALVREQRDLVVLSGRCYERELVPYKAFDGIVDALSRFMTRLPASDAASLLPTRPGPLMQLFPVLRRVEAIAQAPRPDARTLDPLEIRSRAFSAMRELVTRLADRRPLIFVIDDLQWADADSLALLAELMRPPDAPVFLLVATVRPVEGGIDPAAALPGDVRRMQVERLPENHARALAALLLERAAPAATIDAAQIALEADGHPLFIDELVRHAARPDEKDAASKLSKLEEALWARMERLDESPKRVMELLCVAGAPLPQETLARAAGIDLGEFAKVSAYLRVAHLVLTTGSRGTDRIEPYHDRVRAALLAHVDADDRRALHRRLAVAFEASASRDAEALAVHWRGAEDIEQAAKYAVMAAEQAEDALAFDRAARFYQMALDLTSGDEPRRLLQARLGDALANAGRGARAAEAFVAAANGANAAEALDLRRRAAEQLLRSGHFDRGLAAIRDVLAAVKMRLPESAFWTIVTLLWWRFLIAVRGLRYKERDPSQVSARELTRIDICWSVSFMLSLVDVIRGKAFQSRHLLLALAAGEPYRVARAIGIEAGYVGTAGNHVLPKCEGMIRRAHEIATRTKSTQTIANVRAFEGALYYVNGKFRKSLDVCDDAQRILREQTTGTSWEVVSMQFFSLQCLAYLGELKELCKRRPLYLREAFDRGDLYAAVNLRIGYPNLAWLADDDPESGRRDVREAMRDWSQQGFHLEHYFELLALTNCDLYDGAADGAYKRVVDRWPALRRSMLLRVQAIRIVSWHMHARSALATALTLEPRAREPLVREALTAAARIHRETATWGKPLATLLRAGAAAARGDSRGAEATLERALPELASQDLHLHAACARRALGVLRGGTDGDALVAQADAWMGEQRIKNPARMTRAMVPGL